MLLYWPHPSALVVYNGGTNVGPGPGGILFLSVILFPVQAHWMLAMALESLFLGLNLCLVPKTPCETMLYCMLLYWPYPSALVA